MLFYSFETQLKISLHIIRLLNHNLYVHRYDHMIYENEL